MIVKNPYVIDSEHVCIQGNKLKEVDSFCYLGSTISNDGDCYQDIKRRKAVARATFKNLNKLWQDRRINIKTKLRIFTTNVLAILFYGTETWKTNKSIDKQINTFQIQCLRNILRIKWYERITNEEVSKRINSKSANLLIKKKRWTYLGHVIRKNENTIANQTCHLLLKENMQGKTKQGRPKDTYKRTIIKEIGAMWNNIENKAKDRKTWKKLTNALCAY